MDIEALKHFRDKFRVPIADADLIDLPLIRFAPDSPQAKTISAERREALGGSCRFGGKRLSRSKFPPLSSFETQLKGTEGRKSRRRWRSSGF